jgi:hypothetical protein
MKHSIYALIGCSLLLVATAAFGQTIDVVVLNAKNGRGIGNADVWVQFYEPPANRVLQRIKYKTGPDGTAHIQLAAPPPAHLTLSASVNPFYPGFVNAATADIVSQGAMTRCDPRASCSRRTPSPRQVLLLMYRIPWWVRLLAPLERE